MTLDRRENPRYHIDRPATIEFREKDEIIKLTVQLLDINRQSARIAAPILLTCSEPIQIDIQGARPAAPGLKMQTRIEQSRDRSGVFEHILAFEPMSKTEEQQFLLFLDCQNEICDRRLKAKAEKSEKPPSMMERRLTKPIFLKCLRYNRIYKLMEKRQYHYLRELHSGSCREVVIEGRPLINFSSNNYLGLSTHPEVKEAAAKALEKYGMGTGSSRILGGTVDIHNELEKKIAQFKGEEDCIVFNSGYHANVGVLSSLLGKNEHVVIDAKSHASIIDGCFLSGAQLSIFRHNDMADLQRKLNKIGAGQSIMIVSDGVFSMDGDIAKLVEMAELAKTHNAAIMLDDAHALGVLGQNGRGTSEHFNLKNVVDVTMGTLSKAAGALGGFVAGKKRLIHFLKHNCRSFIFTTSLPPAISASALKALELMEKEPHWIQRLWKNIHLLKKRLTEAGYDIGPSQTAIFPIMIRDEAITYKMTDILEKEGIFVPPVAYPAVKKKESRLRVSLMATHDEQDIERLVEALQKTRRSLNLPMEGDRAKAARLN